MVIIHMKRIIIHFRGVKYRITSRIIICFIGCANKLYFSGPARVLLHTCVSTIDATHPCMCHVQAHEKIDFMNSIIPFLSIYEIFYHQLNVSLTRSMNDNWQLFSRFYRGIRKFKLRIIIFVDPAYVNHQNDYYYYYKIFISFIIYNYKYIK